MDDCDGLMFALMFFDVYYIPGESVVLLLVLLCRSPFVCVWRAHEDSAYRIWLPGFAASADAKRSAPAWRASAPWHSTLARAVSAFSQAPFWVRLPGFGGLVSSSWSTSAMRRMVLCLWPPPPTAGHCNLPRCQPMTPWRSSCVAVATHASPHVLAPVSSTVVRAALRRALGSAAAACRFPPAPLQYGSPLVRQAYPN